MATMNGFAPHHHALPSPSATNFKHVKGGSIVKCACSEQGEHDEKDAIATCMWAPWHRDNENWYTCVGAWAETL
jgi:hypothetical protein